MTEETQKVPRFTRRDESRLLKAAIRALHSSFPNHERLGCPGRDALEAIARRRLSFPEVEDVIDHIATCPPCFDGYTRCRQRHRRRVVSRVAFAGGVSLVLAITVWWRVSPVLFSVRSSPGERPSSAAMTVTLDLRNRTVERSGQSHLAQQVEVPHLRRELLAMTIKLPIGMEDGVYSVQIRDGQDRTIVNAVGTAKWNGSAEVLTTTIDLRGPRPGEYLLAVGKNGSSWRKYPVRLE